MGKFVDWYENFSLKFDKKYQILVGISLVVVIVGVIVGTYFGKPKPEPVDKNVYLNEEICFADEVFIKVIGLRVEENAIEAGDDIEGDKLSKYFLNLTVSVHQRNTDFYTNKITISPEMFLLKSVNLKSKSKMAVFFESMAKATLNSALSVAMGDVNIIDELVGFAEQYAEGSIENAENSKTDFKSMKLEKTAFEPFKPRESKEPIILNISFPIKQEYLESDNVIVLTVDKIDKWEKRIFLMTRPILDNKE